MTEPSLDGQTIGLIGGTSQVGRVIIADLLQRGARVVAFSRQTGLPSPERLTWLAADAPFERLSGVTHWLSLAPAYALPHYLDRLGRAGARRLVVLSSTSLLTKQASAEPREREIAAGLEHAEAAAWDWAERNSAAVTVLRPTLIYGYGRDINVAEIARFIRRFGVFPLLGEARGLRQPVHVDDVARAALTALFEDRCAGRTLILAGGETLPYREMVVRIFVAMGRKPALLTLPIGAFRSAISLLRILPRYRNWTPQMAERMNKDQVFDATETEILLDIAFRPFRPTPADVGLVPMLATPLTPV